MENIKDIDVFKKVRTQIIKVMKLINTQTKMKDNKDKNEYYGVKDTNQ